MQYPADLYASFDYASLKKGLCFVRPPPDTHQILFVSQERSLRFIDTTRSLNPIVEAYDLAFMGVVSIKDDAESRHKLIFSQLGTRLFMVV